MAVLLRNQRNRSLKLALTAETWLGLLDLAVAYHWNALGAVLPGHWQSLEYALGDYMPDGLPGGAAPATPEAARLVVVEDALNLADALDLAFLDYEPRRLRASTLLFAIEDPAVDQRPSIGAIAEASAFCRRGAFWIELYHPPEVV